MKLAGGTGTINIFSQVHFAAFGFGVAHSSVRGISSSESINGVSFLSQRELSIESF